MKEQFETTLGAEFPPDDDEKRHQKAVARISDKIVAQLLITETYFPLVMPPGMKLEKSLLKSRIFPTEPKEGVVEQMIDRAEHIVEEALASSEVPVSHWELFEPFKIAGLYGLKRDLLQRAGDTWVNQALLSKPDQRNTILRTMLLDGLLEWDYLPPRELLSEAVLDYLRRVKETTDGPKIVFREYENIQTKLQEYGIRADEIVEQDEGLFDTLTFSR